MLDPAVNRFRSGISSVTIARQEAEQVVPPDVEADEDTPLTLGTNFLSSFAGRLQSDVDTSEKVPSPAPKEIGHSHHRHKPTIFHGSKHTPIPVGEYVQRIAEHSKCSRICFVASYGYLQRLSKVDSKYRLCSRSVHRLLISSVLIAAKLLDDKFYSNAFYARIGGISTKEINRLELEMLRLLDFRVFTSRADLRVCLADLSSHPSCQPDPPPSEAVGRKRTNDPPSAETAIPSKLQHSTGKDQILVTPAQEPLIPDPPVTRPEPPRERGVASRPRSASVGARRSSSGGCGSWDVGGVRVVQTAVDVG